MKITPEMSAILSANDAYLSQAEYDQGMEFGDGAFFVCKKQRAQ